MAFVGYFVVWKCQSGHNCNKAIFKIVTINAVIIVFLLLQLIYFLYFPPLFDVAIDNNITMFLRSIFTAKTKK